eukprot:350223-Chlamydomonas_euryale.AAC.4
MECFISYSCSCFNGMFHFTREASFKTMGGTDGGGACGWQGGGGVAKRNDWHVSAGPAHHLAACDAHTWSVQTLVAHHNERTSMRECIFMSHAQHLGAMITSRAMACAGRAAPYMHAPCASL